MYDEARSAHKKVTFRDVAGADDAKEQLHHVVDFLRRPHKSQKLTWRAPKGVLLVGPPGTGKTLLARAVAGEADVPLFSISGSRFAETFAGVRTSQIHDLFAHCKRNGPCILFLDEIDAVSGHSARILDQLLVEMDRLKSDEGVVVIAATNRPDMLDPALLRPGRFDLRVVLPRPDVGGREDVLKVHTKKIPLSNDVDISVLARGTPGFSGADLVHLVSEAALLAARQNRGRVMMADFEAAKAEVLSAGQSKSMIISEEERKHTAYFDAGHALVACLMPHADLVHKVTIVPRGNALGTTTYLPLDNQHTDTREYMESHLAILMGGRVAEEIFLNTFSTGAGHSIEQAVELARRMVREFGLSTQGRLALGQNDGDLSTTLDSGEDTAARIDEEVRRFVNAGYQRAKEIISANRETLVRIAESLLERESLDASDIKLLVEGKALPLRS